MSAVETPRKNASLQVFCMRDSQIRDFARMRSFFAGDAGVQENARVALGPVVKNASDIE